LRDDCVFCFDKVLCRGFRKKVGRIVEAALAIKYDNFASYLERMLDELFIDRMDGTEEVFSKVMSDQSFRSAVHSGLARELYERIRAGRRR